MAVDLRAIVGAMRVAIDLERIGDLASTCTVRTDEAMEEEKP
ncbi:MAG: hypothetical protein J0H45_07755 [Stenotrophomonas nitritireducens]|uniref:PhoU domain-containing protein n=1 Tax=Stenotrophomonas nitritireducens TaxID=83617 RepID=A0A9D8KYG1_9GAMM|nr:hypothetical protein [Stenotrophomonas nitritireducens]